MTTPTTTPTATSNQAPTTTPPPTEVAAVSAISHAEAMGLAETEFRRTLDQLRLLGADE